MQNILRLALLVTSLLVCVGTGAAQVNTSAPASQVPEQSLATVYVYRLDEGSVILGFFHKMRAVYLGESKNSGPQQKNIKIAGLRDKHYFMLRLPAGKYIFDTQSMWGDLELEVAAGGEYYLRVDQGNDCPTEDPLMIGPPSCESRNASIETVSPERWGNEKSVLKPIKGKDVKNRNLVIIPSSTPSDNDMNPTAS